MTLVAGRAFPLYEPERSASKNLPGVSRILKIRPMEIIIGSTRDRAATLALGEKLQGLSIRNGILFLGYPVIGGIDDPVHISALLVSQEHGVVIFDVLGDDLPDENDLEAWIEERQDQLLVALTAKLLPLRELRSGPQLAFPIRVLTVASTIPQSVALETVATPETVAAKVSSFSGLRSSILPPLLAAIQRVNTIKPKKKRQTVQQEQSKGAILKDIERSIANLDKWQNRAAVEAPEGPQRIRGLAGSGKTIVLALKAAYLHAQHPDWTIVVTFYTRSLHSQFVDLIRRFYYNHSGEEPDWTRLRVMHCWGAVRRAGVYSEVADALKVEAKDYAYGKSKFGTAAAFQGICEELVQHIRNSGEIKPLFDAVLIDEAQDLPREFFQIVYLVTRNPKRVIWAYDELQNLGSYAMAPPSELFGKDPSSGQAYVQLRNEQNAPHQDIVLPVCYRNTPWALTIAHALGFGIYRDGDLVQLFDDLNLWKDIGYDVISGTLDFGHQVRLSRTPRSTPSFFGERLSPDDAFKILAFESHPEQCEWTAEQIQYNLAYEELDHDDILVIFCDPMSAATRASSLKGALHEKGIPSHTVGVDRMPDEFFLENSIAISGIFRAKGNEASMVYILDSDRCFGGSELIRKRNILFTAVTRSKAWVRMTGCGPAMHSLLREVNRVVENNFVLNFKIPSELDIASFRRIHRDMTDEERRKQQKTVKDLKQVLNELEQGNVSLSDLDPQTRQRLKLWLAENGE